MEPRNNFEAVLGKFRKATRKDYDSFVSKVANPSISDAELVKCLKSLKDCATLLDNEHEVLIGVLLKLDWMRRSSAVVQMYQSMMLNIVSVHTVYLRACLRALIKHFMPVLRPVESKETPEGFVTDEMMAAHNQGFTHVHTLIKTIMKIVPMSSNLLMPLLIDNYPFFTKDVYIQECFMKNLLQITYYKPDLRQSIMELLIEKVIKLDTRAPRSAILEARLQDESQESGIFNMDEETSPVIEYTDKLDVLMVHLFEYIQSVCHKDGELEWEGTKRFYREMLYIFEKVILPTYACCHIQFIMFYLVSFRMQLCDGFLDYLWKLVQNPNVHSVYRQSAVAYMGSLLARAKFVSIRTVMRTVELMMKWAHTYTHTCQDCVMADVVHHGPFYSVCQSVFYVFAFRQKEIFETKAGLKWAKSLQFQHLVQSRLNPLKVCLPLVVKTFASITRQHQLAFCDHIIQQNNRSFLPVDSSSSQTSFETYFPFDPYLLKRSMKYVEPHYRKYDQSVAVDDDSSGEEDEDEMFTDDIPSSEAVDIVTMTGSLVDKTDLMSYGTSPGFKHIL
ncbi:RNA polymerase I-specific transcription initiation factor RRN3-like [Mercenaria mercenaria]|uniref:RNA polymerase I-specific transcription initiation factor RRN3-like n=1 Tax=Mercenaria mercenaria TaxID=6596 RepID=UPI00234F6574|nr:RNA polymerase I-specific transcription initiation factor RRN3-like [Mercenaria mercenaria]